MGGFNQESSYRETMEAYSYGQAVIEVPSLGSGTSTLKATDSYNEYSVRGGFFRVNYNYLDRYLLEVNGRYDGSSKFPKDSRYGFLPIGFRWLEYCSGKVYGTYTKLVGLIEVTCVLRYDW